MNKQIKLISSLDDIVNEINNINAYSDRITESELNQIYSTLFTPNHVQEKKDKNLIDLLKSCLVRDKLLLLLKQRNPIYLVYLNLKDDELRKVVFYHYYDETFARHYYYMFDSVKLLFRRTDGRKMITQKKYCDFHDGFGNIVPVYDLTPASSSTVKNRIHINTPIARINGVNVKNTIFKIDELDLPYGRLFLDIYRDKLTTRVIGLGEQTLINFTPNVNVNEMGEMWRLFTALRSYDEQYLIRKANADVLYTTILCFQKCRLNIQIFIFVLTMMIKIPTNRLNAIVWAMQQKVSRCEICFNKTFISLKYCGTCINKYI